MKGVYLHLHSHLHLHCTAVHRSEVSQMTAGCGTHHINLKNIKKHQ
jgi:hypothetical protein